MGKKTEDEVEVDCHCDINLERAQFTMRAPGISCVVTMRPTDDPDLHYSFVRDIPEMVDKMVTQATKEMEKHRGA